MKKGKFEAGRNTAKPAARAAAPTARAAAAPATRAPAKKKKKSGVKAWPIIAAVAGLAVVISGVLFYNSYKDDGLIYPNVYAGGVNIGGMTQEEALQAISPISRQYQENDMVLTVAPAQPTGDAEKDETFTLTIPPEKSAKRLIRLANGRPGTDFQPGETYTGGGKKIMKFKFRDPDGAAARSLWEQCEAMVGKYL